MARRIESDPAVLLFGIREGLPSSFDDADLPELSLSGLDLDASNALLDLGAATLPVDLRRRILEEAAGNPLALIELPLLGLVLMPDRTRSLTEKFNNWMTAHRRIVIVILAGAIGAYLLISGIPDLS